MSGATFDHTTGAGGGASAVPRTYAKGAGMAHRNEGPKDWPDAIIRLLERQAGMINELAALSSQQSDLIKNDQTEALLDLLTERQEIIERFTTAQKDLGELTEHLESRLPSVDAVRRARIQALIGAVGDRLGDVMDQDESDQRTLRAAHDRELRSPELPQAERGRRAQAAARRTRDRNTTGPGGTTG